MWHYIALTWNVELHLAIWLDTGNLRWLLIKIGDTATFGF